MYDKLDLQRQVDDALSTASLILMQNQNEISNKICLDEQKVDLDLEHLFDADMDISYVLGSCVPRIKEKHVHLDLKMFPQHLFDMLKWEGALKILNVYEDIIQNMGFDGIVYNYGCENESIVVVHPNIPSFKNVYDVYSSVQVFGKHADGDRMSVHFAFPNFKFDKQKALLWSNVSEEYIESYYKYIPDSIVELRRIVPPNGAYSAYESFQATFS